MRVNADSACGPPVARHLLAQSCIERMREPDTRFLQLLRDDRGCSPRCRRWHTSQRSHICLTRGWSRPAVSDESTFCLQCWGVYSLQFRGRRTQHRKQQRRCRRDDRDDLSDLMIQAAPTHLDTRLYELTG